VGGPLVNDQGRGDDPEIYDEDQLVLSDLINRVLDKGVVISANIVISIADIDLVQLDLRLLISSVNALMARSRVNRADIPVRTGSEP
jgi:gas vesicle structural protein